MEDLNSVAGGRLEEALSIPLTDLLNRVASAVHT